MRAQERDDGEQRAAQLGPWQHTARGECLDLGRKCRMRAGRPGTDGVATSTFPQVGDPGRVAVGWGASGGGGGRGRGEEGGGARAPEIAEEIPEGCLHLLLLGKEGLAAVPCLPDGNERRGVPERDTPALQ